MKDFCNPKQDFRISAEGTECLCVVLRKNTGVTSLESLRAHLPLAGSGKGEVKAACYLGRCRNSFPASDKGSSLRFSARKVNTGRLGDDQA